MSEDGGGNATDAGVRDGQGRRDGDIIRVGRGDKRKELDDGGAIPTTSTATEPSEGTSSRLRSRIREIFGDRRQRTIGVSAAKKRIVETDEDLEQQYWEGFKARCAAVFKDMQKSNGYLVRDIYRFDNDEEVKTFLRVIQEDEHYTRGLLKLCIDSDHIHVVHDCAFSNGYCRCDWFKKAKTHGLHIRRDKCGHRRNSCRSRTEADIQSLFLYYCTGGKWNVYEKIRGQTTRLPREGIHLEKGRFNEIAERIGEMEIQIPRDGSELQLQDQDGEAAEPDKNSPSRTLRRKKHKLGAQAELQQQILTILRQNPVSPTTAITRHKVWRENPALRFKTSADPLVKPVIASFNDELMTWSIHDYQEMYNDPKCKPIFSAVIGEFEDTYYDKETSIKILMELLKYQCSDDEDGVKDFMQTLYNVLERKIPKLNCLVVKSPPSSGKNFFFDAIKDYYINCGQLGNVNKYSTFGFQEADGRRLVFWNEPNYSPEYLESIKKILGGDATCVNVKYLADQPIYRTPVIVMTNNTVSFMTNTTFRDRLKIYNWRAAPYLKQYDKKPNPIAIYDLFKMFVEGL